MTGRMRVELDPEPASAGRARRFVRRTLETQGAVEAAELGELLTSELVTNAVLYSQGPIEVTVATDDTGVLVAVGDRNPVLPQRRAPGSDATSGRGLQLVGALADAWGVQQDGQGKQVWFQLHR